MDDLEEADYYRYVGRTLMLIELAWAYFDKPCYIPEFTLDLYERVSSVKDPSKYITLKEATEEFLSILLEDKRKLQEFQSGENVQKEE